MKKAFLRTIAALLCLSLLFPLTACSNKPDLMKLEESERADAFFDLVNKDPADSYTVEMKMELEGTLYGTTVKADSKSETTYVGYAGDDPILHSEGSSTVKVGEVEEISKNIFGFANGKMYESRESSGETTSLVSEISASDFKALEEKLVGYTEEELTALHKSATVKECKKDEDGSWKASFSGYSAESIASLVDYCFDPTVLLFDGYSIKDIVFTVESDADFLPTDWDYRIVFEPDGTEGEFTEPRAKTDVKFDNIGSAKDPTPDLSGYTEAQGLADLRVIRDLLSEKLYSESGSFNLETKQTVTSVSTWNYTRENDSVEYETQNGKYSFDIKVNVSNLNDREGTTYHIRYYNGLFSTLGSGISNTNQEMAESNARLFIYSLSDPAGLAEAHISNIKTGGEGYTYSFVIKNPDTTALETSLAATGASDFSSEAEVSVLFEDGEIKKYYYILTLKCSAGGQDFTIKTEYTVTPSAE